VNLERREITVRAINAKTRTARILPISSRLLATLEMRKLDPAGRPFGLEDLQFRDLRHEAGSRFDEAGVSTNYVSKLLGHASLSTTTRYLNIQRRGLHLAMEKLEESQKAAGRGAAEESGGTGTQECGAPCTSVAHDRENGTSLCVRARQLSFP
jgi:integrase